MLAFDVLCVRVRLGGEFKRSYFSWQQLHASMTYGYAFGLTLATIVIFTLAFIADLLARHYYLVDTTSSEYVDNGATLETIDDQLSGPSPQPFHASLPPYDLHDPVSQPPSAMHYPAIQITYGCKSFVSQGCQTEMTSDNSEPNLESQV